MSTEVSGVSYRSEVRQVLLITLLLNVLVMVLKLVVGFWTGSLSLLADALHSVTDSANNILGLVTNQLASRPFFLSGGLGATIGLVKQTLARTERYQWMQAFFGEDVHA